MPVLITALVYLCLAAAVLAARGKPAYPAAKALAGAGFCALALVCALRPGASPWPLPLPAAFVLCAAGDVAMGLYNLHRSARALRWGGVLFAAGHLCLIAGLWRRTRPTLWCFVFALLAAALLALALRGGVLDMGRMGGMGVGYCFAVSLMAAQGTALALHAPQPATLLFAAGGVLFWASDLILLGLYFSRKKGSAVLHVANLASYYGGMLLMALSMGAAAPPT